ncbi:MAG: hypothetical protein M3373_08010 [Gemmatimonadota bacterium]|nr:hypothetical protein [Gemmatimonadota bacterium]
MDARLRTRLDAALGAPGGVAAEEEIVVLVRVEGEAVEPAMIGLAGGTRVGNIAIGRVPLRAVVQLAQHPSVSFVEMTRPLGYDAQG